jgi:lipoprotein-releasing system permease protein
MREGKLDDLSRASNGVIIGEALAEKLGLKVGNLSFWSVARASS